MNRSYKQVWNKKQGRYVVASEVAKSHRSGSSNSSVISKAIVAILALLTGITNAQAVGPNDLPTNPVVTSGSAVISQSQNKLIINQATDKLITNWSTFNIGGNASVQFVQPSATATALNRVNASDPTYIYGSLSANGKVILINQNGVLFANGARVDVSGIIASTLNFSDANFLANNFIFEKDGIAAAITNAGELKAFVGGAVALIAPQVINAGTISAEGGDIALLAGNKVTLTLNGNRLIKYSIDQGSLDAMVQNNSVIRAAEGVVILSAKALDTISKSVVNNTGLIEAKGITQSGGRIILDADGGSAENSGTLDVSSSAAIGGSIRVTGDVVAIKSGSNLLATGDQGGGDILVGGSWQNSDSSIRQAITTTIESNANLNASATSNGDGGKIVAWSDISNVSSSTLVLGSLNANGGANSGNGGNIETSGHHLDVSGISVSTVAPNGSAGNWLLDPYDITISSGTSSASVNSTANGINAFEGSGAVSSSVINNATIATALATTNVTIQSSTGLASYAGGVSGCLSKVVSANTSTSIQTLSAFTGSQSITLSLNTSAGRSSTSSSLKSIYICTQSSSITCGPTNTSNATYGS
ncbi:MAG: filamentous hemagglutinin N-terminal domain-containing protein, partial [Methylococcales bacterium]